MHSKRTDPYWMEALVRGKPVGQPPPTSQLLRLELRHRATTKALLMSRMQARLRLPADPGSLRVLQERGAQPIRNSNTLPQSLGARFHIPHTSLTSAPSWRRFVARTYHRFLNLIGVQSISIPSRRSQYPRSRNVPRPSGDSRMLGRNMEGIASCHIRAVVTGPLCEFAQISRITDRTHLITPAHVTKRVHRSKRALYP